ncbi:MAG: hypothetical protein QMD71_02195 [bacterium]|nr:hypothetical protein [bacterium]
MRKYLVFTFIFTTGTVPIRGQSPEIKFYFFYSEDCKYCQEVIKKIITPLKQKYNLNMKSFEITEPNNYELLVRLEEKYKDTNNEIPVVVVGEYILGGDKEIKKNLEKIIQRYRETGCEFPEIEMKRAVPTQDTTAKMIYIAYFYKKMCRECDRINYELKYLESKYTNLTIKKFDIGDIENKKLNEALCQLYNVPKKRRLVTPAVFIGEEFLIGKEINRKKIIDLIEKYKISGTKIPWEEAKEVKDKSEIDIRDRFNTMGVLTVIFAGLIDGVNPCAIATVVLFISFLSFIGKKGKELLLAGITFTSSVFITYFLIGMGIFQFIRNCEFIPIFRKAIFSITAILAVVFGGLSIYDYFKLRAGNYEEAKLKLPKFFKKRIDDIIRQKMEMRSYILSAAIIGFLISICEFVCTGQVYLPTILFVVKSSSLKLKGLAYLFLYNFGFILPLAIVFTASYRGTTSINLTLFWRKHAVSIKLVTSLLFFWLASLLAFYIRY